MSKLKIALSYSEEVGGQSSESARRVLTDLDSEVVNADYRKLVQILVDAQLIRLSNTFNLYNDDIYNPDIITQSTWIKPNSLFIIIGDLIDGRRNGNEVNDNYGSFELL